MTIKLLWAFLWEKRAALMWAVLCMVIFGLLCFFYHLPMTAVWYGVVLCAAVGLAGGCWCFMHYCAREKALRLLKDSVLHDPSLLPCPCGKVESAYDALLRSMLEANGRLEADHRETLRRQLDTYSLWTHQIKVPISAMRLTLTESATQRDATLLAELFKIEQYTDMALNYVRLNAASTDYVIREYELDDILRQLLRKFAPLFIQKKLRLLYEPVRLKVLTDEKWLLFALEQALSNAIKYTKAGSVTLSVDPAAETLYIRDTGIGIAPEDLPRVFDQGYTGYNGRNDRRATGLGLFLCRQTLNRLGHSIALASEVDAGTCVTICLKRDRVVHE